MFKKRALLFILILVIILALFTACKKYNNYEGYFMANDTIRNLKTYSFDSAATVVISKDKVNNAISKDDKNNFQLQNDINLFLNIKGEIDKINKIMFCDIGYKTKSEDNYITALSVIADDKFFYIKIRPLINAIFNIFSPMFEGMTQRDFENIMTQNVGSKEYIAIPLKTSGFNIWEENNSSKAILEMKNRITGILKKQLPTMQKAFAYNKRQNEYSMTLQNVDIQTLLNNFLDDAEENTNWYFDTLTNIMEEQNRTEISSQLQKERTASIVNLKDSIAEIKKGIAKMEGVSIVSKLAYSKGEKKYTIYLKISYMDSNYLEVTQTLRKKDSISVDIPTNYYDCSQIIDNTISSSINKYIDSDEQDSEIPVDDDIVLPTNPEEISFEEIPEELSYENHDSSSVEFPDSSLQLENKYQFIQTKNILVNGKTYKVIYIKGDNWYYISNDGLFSSKGNISITTRVVPYVNPEETAKDLVDNVIAYEKKRLENNTISTYRIQSSHVQGSQDSAYGIIRYNMNDGVYEYIGCYNIYKREISQDKKNIIETTLTYTPGYWSEDINEPSTIKEIIDYMNVDI